MRSKRPPLINRQQRSTLPSIMWSMLVTAFEVVLGVVGLLLVALGIYGVVRGKFGQQTSGGAMGGTISLPLSGLILLLGLGALGFAVYLAADQPTKIRVVLPHVSATLPSASSTLITSISPTPTPPTPAPSLMTLGCKLSDKKLRAGLTIQLTYQVYSPVARRVGLGAGLYDEQGTDHSNGDGDVSVFTLKQGQSSPSRPVTIPADLPSGKYELDAEIWPANKIGQNGVNDIIDTTCANFNVP